MATVGLLTPEIERQEAETVAAETAPPEGTPGERFWIIDPRYSTTEDNDHALAEGGRRDATATQVGGIDRPAAWETPMIQVSEAQLRDYFDTQPFLQQQFGDFDNYLGYQTQYTAAYDAYIGDNWGWQDVPQEVQDLQQQGRDGFWDTNTEEGLQQYTDYLNSIEEYSGSDRVWTPEEAQRNLVSGHVGNAVSDVGSYIGDIPVGPITLPDGTVIGGGSVGIGDPSQTNFGTGDAAFRSDHWAARTGRDIYLDFQNSPEIQALNAQYGIDPNATFRVVGEDGNIWSVNWNGTGFESYQFQDVPNTMRTGDYIQAAAIGGLTAGLGAGLGALAGAGGTAAGAGGAAAGAGGAAGGSVIGGALAAGAQNALATAIVQGAVTGSVDPRSLVTAGLTAGIGELANYAADGLIGASGDIGAGIDNFAWDLADALGTDVGTVYDMAAGLASGAVSGADVEDLILGAVGTYTSSQLKDYIRTNYADQFGDIDVNNWFDDETTSIDYRAFDPFVEEIVGGALGDDVTAEDFLKALWESGTYEGTGPFDQGGTFEYADPTKGALGDLENPFNNIDLPGIELPDVNLPDIPLPDLPDIPFPDLPDVELPEVDLPEVDLPEVDLPEVDLPEVDVPEVDVPEVDLPEAPDIETPDVDLPSIDLPKAGLMAAAPAAFEEFYTGDISTGRRTPVMLDLGQPTTSATDELNQLITRRLGGGLLS